MYAVHGGAIDRAVFGLHGALLIVRTLTAATALHLAKEEFGSEHRHHCV
jgi:hypothetical protein